MDLEGRGYSILPLPPSFTCPMLCRHHLYSFLCLRLHRAQIFRLLHLPHSPRTGVFRRDAAHPANSPYTQLPPAVSAALEAGALCRAGSGRPPAGGTRAPPSASPELLARGQRAPARRGAKQGRWQTGFSAGVAAKRRFPCRRS